MNVKKIIVDELPNMCIDCKLSFYSRDNEVYICFATKDRIANSQVIPDWCPLEVEEVCEWQIKPSTAKWYGKPMYDIVKQCDPDSFYSAVIDKDKEAKCNCGKRIKYVEVE